MILLKDLLNNLKKNNISFFTGVPDSILKVFCNYLTKRIKTSQSKLFARPDDWIYIKIYEIILSAIIELVTM